MIQYLTVVKFVGPVDHPDFGEALAVLRATAQFETGGNPAPEVVIVAQARPGQITQTEIEFVQRRWPLAGIVAILGSWCEGETRTGKPWPGIKRFYSYEFPAWWQQQIAQRAGGHCPEWLRPTNELYRSVPIRNPREVDSPRQESRHRQRGLIRLSTASRDTAEALADILHNSGYVTVWDPPNHAESIVRGAVAGVWDGGQLEDHELLGLAAFCHSLARDAVPVVALLDFPRRDRCDIARQLGVATVLGKPWINADLIATIGEIVTRSANTTKSTRCAA
jgi:hypothetical protein